MYVYVCVCQYMYRLMYKTQFFRVFVLRPCELINDKTGEA